jgi:NADH-quinone oxidoreductase subunit E
MSENSFRKIADESIQPPEFKFSKLNLDRALNIKKNYPSNYPESSIMPLLMLAQSQNNGWVPKKAIEYVANFLKVPEIKVLEIATFYTMYNLSPIGNYHIEVCTTTPCMLRGSDEIVKACKKKIGIKIGEISEDKKFSLNRVECLGACVNAPVVKINENYFEDLDLLSFNKLIEGLEKGKELKIGPQIKRKGSEPMKG